MTTTIDAFVPGSYWTPKRAEAAVRAMLERLASPDLQRVMAEAADPRWKPAGPAPGTGRERAPTPVALDGCAFRRGRPGDEQPMAALMAAADLPPLFIEEFLPGFVAVEHDGEIIACGGAEPYGDAAVIRSVVVDPRARRLGLARRISALLIEDMRLAGAREAYLFTVEAYPFWRQLGFDDVSLSSWPEPARASWQYLFVSRNPGAVPGIHSMRRAIAPDG